MEELAKPAIKTVEEGKVKFIPKKYETTYFNWMKNIKDWCISRQIWWGHQIPAYYCDKCGEITVSNTEPEKCSKCGHEKLTRDTDTLDTWFSSALWPFSTMGWPNTKAEDLKTFFPTNTLVTGYDIIQAWVSRMIYSSLAYTNEIPFDDVLIHGIVRDAKGRKMSKSLGNGIDPIEIIDEYGADALRFSVLSGTTMGNDIRYMPEKLEQASNFANKIWNAAKFVIANTDKEEVANFKKEDLSIEDKINAIATKIYGADGVDFTPQARKELEKLEKLGFSHMPICMAKTQYSLTDDQTKLGRPTGFRITVRQLTVSAGAGFIVALTGAIMKMPGLPKVPAAERIDVDENGIISGLF